MIKWQKFVPGLRGLFEKIESQEKKLDMLTSLIGLESGCADSLFDDLEILGNERNITRFLQRKIR